MKKSLLLLMLLAIASASFAKKINSSQVPEPVRTAFSKNFSNATNVKWEKENGNYEANFKQNDKLMSASFNEKGEWLETEEVIKVSELPADLTSYVSKNYMGAKIKEAERVKKAGDIIQYEVEVKGKELVFDEKGSFIKEEKD